MRTDALALIARTEKRNNTSCPIFIRVSRSSRLLFFKSAGTFSARVRRHANFHLNFPLIRETGYIRRMTLIRAPGYNTDSIATSVRHDRSV